MKTSYLRFLTYTLVQFKRSKTTTPLTNLDRIKQDQIRKKPFTSIYNMSRKFQQNLVHAFNHWLNAPDGKVNDIVEILQIAHTISLITYDIQDNSELRYDLHTAHDVHGIGLAINAVSQALTVVFENVLTLGHPQAIKIYLNAFKDGNRGQGIELYWRENCQCPTQEEYIDMLKLKSSSMFVLIVQLLQLFSDSVENYHDIATLMGVYFQIRNDYCNLFNREHIHYRNGDRDITAGKFTLPIIHAIESSDSTLEIIDILKQRTSDSKLVNHCISLLEMVGSAKYAESVLRRLENDIEDEISRLGGNPKLGLIMKKLRNWRRM